MTLARMLASIALPVVAIAFAIAATATSSDRAMASAGDSIDSVSGYICVTLPCDYVISMRDRNVICLKTWPNNDRRRKVELQCKKKIGNRWVPVSD